MSEKHWISDFDLLENLDHINKCFKLKEYNRLTFLERCDKLNFYEHTTIKKGKKYNGLYFYEVQNFRFYPFLTYKHFVCVVKYGNTIEYFDSLGDRDKYFHRLKSITKGTNYNVICNKKQYQTNSYSCGRYVILRCLMYFNDLNEFDKILDENKTKYNLKDYDETIDFILSKYYNVNFI